ncbi:ABC transporter ATP-binding protein [Megasphaera sueciensis]|jgi:oligopeptide/dipeptide ABC transporter ATP-binding protein|uniref:ABC transporter ATP-binding protein n=1 Tax=Megasphaera sueciensis TaxID=349094 RepID=UPI003D06B4BC
MEMPIYEISNVVKEFPIKQNIFEILQHKKAKTVCAVDNVSFKIQKGETLALVGESGCGKSTLAKTLALLYTPDKGSLMFNGKNLQDKSNKNKIRSELQMIFQDPQSSLNPVMTVRQMLYEVFSVHHLCSRTEREAKALHVLNYVGMGTEALDRKPTQLSGGQRQRVNIARALAMNPSFLIADEPLSALDVSIQAQIVNLLLELQEKLCLTMLFISHDMRMVRYIADKVAVMYLGSIVEIGTTKDLYEHPAHPYTDILIKAAPLVNPDYRSRKYAIKGEIPSPIDLPSGCRFAPRCPKTCEKCRKMRPELTLFDKNRSVACFYPEE